MWLPEWVLGIGTATAEAVTEKGSAAAISEREEEILAVIEQRLRQGSETTGR